MNQELGIMGIGRRLFLIVFLFIIHYSLFIIPVDAQEKSLISRFTGGSRLPAPAIPPTLRLVTPRISLESPPPTFSLKPRTNPLSFFGSLRERLQYNFSDVRKSLTEIPKNPQVKVYIFPPFSDFLKESQGMDDKITIIFAPINFNAQFVRNTNVSCGQSEKGLDQESVAYGEGFFTQVRLGARGLFCRASFDLKSLDKPVEILFKLPL